MAIERTPAELRAAVDTMFRIRAVESPAGERGLRTVWHRGAKNAELVSEIDGEGRVARHEFTLFDEVLVWQRGRGFTSGRAVHEGSTRGSANVDFDRSLDDASVGRAVSALTPYDGSDRIIGHLRGLVLALHAEKHPTEDLGKVTGETQIPEQLLVAAQRAPPRVPSALPYLIVGTVFIVVGVLWLLLK